MSGRGEMSGRDDESCDIMRHHATSCDRERKQVGSRWRKMSFDRRRCGRETRWRERKAGGSRKRKRKTDDRRKCKGFPLHLPSGCKPLDLKSVYAQKTDTDGNNITGKEKARLVAMGFRQRPEDFGETATLVAKMTSVRILLAWAAVQDWHIFQFDCKTAFLHAWLCHDVYCRPFSGWPVSHPKKVLRILAALYGLRLSLVNGLLRRIPQFRCPPTIPP